MKFHWTLTSFALVVFGTASLSSKAQGINDDAEETSAKYQVTLNRQVHPSFNSSIPNGPNSLTSEQD